MTTRPARTALLRSEGLRAEFLRLLTEDGSTSDRRRRDFNQAIFAPEDEGGYAIFTSTSLDMVMDKFDAAVAHQQRTNE